jgi:hypothetical protein
VRQVRVDSGFTPTPASIASSAFGFFFRGDGPVGRCESCICNSTIDGNSSIAGTLGTAEWARWCASAVGGKNIPWAVEKNRVVGGSSEPCVEGNLIKTPKRLGFQTVSLKFALDGVLLSCQGAYLQACVVYLEQLGAGVGVIVPSPQLAEAGWRPYPWGGIGCWYSVLSSGSVLVMFPSDGRLHSSQLIEPRKGKGSELEEDFS